MADEIQWFPCYPDKLLGALTAMTPVEGYVYTIVLLRMYECGGVFIDGVATLARRCGLSQGKTAKVLDALFSTGRLRQEDDGIHNPKTDEVIKQTRVRILTSSQKWKKIKSNQQNGAHTESICTSSPDLFSEESDSESEIPSLAGWDFDEFWRQYPHKVGKGRARMEFDRVKKKRIVEFADLMLGLSRYAAKTDDRPWCNPATWLHQERWTDVPAKNGGGYDKRSISQVTDRLVQWADEEAARDAGDQNINGFLPR